MHLLWPRGGPGPQVDAPFMVTLVAEAESLVGIQGRGERATASPLGLKVRAGGVSGVNVAGKCASRGSGLGTMTRIFTSTPGIGVALGMGMMLEAATSASGVDSQVNLFV